MTREKVKDESRYLDPVFLQYGMEVYSYEYAEILREENLDLKKKGKRIYNLIPQAGFQEKVLTNPADIIICGGSRGSGKVLPNDTDIVTPFGYRKNGSLTVGSILIDPCTGGFERVIQIFEHPNHDFYEITFDDGSTIECGLEHLWKVRETGRQHKVRKINGSGIETDWRIWDFGMIKKWLDEQAEGKHYDRGSKRYLVIPLTEPVKFTRSTRDMKWRANLDPYIIGALIGDGYLPEGEDSVRLTSIDDEIVDQFRKEGFDMTHTYDDQRSKAIEYRIPGEQIKEPLRKLGLLGCKSEDKFIPKCYKLAPVEDRWAIVQGLMDTDGTTDAKGNSCEFNTASERLAEDLRFVLESLGANVSITKKTGCGYKKDGVFIPCKDSYRLYIKIKNPERLFRLSRKKERCNQFNGGVSEVCRRIVSYRYVGKKDGRCITVDSPNALYMAKDFVVTHNTAVSLMGALAYADNPDINMYGFRRVEADVKRGIWKSCKPIFRGFATFADTSFEVKFYGGNGATMKMEHLADLSKVKDRFRGAEMPYIVIEELAEFTRENLNVIFDLMGSNRSTTGLPSRFICTCNPVGKSNKLRLFLDWWIDPETDEAIPERSGKIRYFCRYGEDVMEIAWGDTPEEVYENPNAKAKIHSLSADPDNEFREYITSLTFIDGNYSENKILHVSDPKYMNRISSGGSRSTINDIRGVWRDVDDSQCLVSIAQMQSFFNNPQQPNLAGPNCAGGDIALSGDLLVLWASSGYHIKDLEARVGLKSEEVIPFISSFLRRNNVSIENFVYDVNGIGGWLRESEALANATAFDNGGAALDKLDYTNLKSEFAGFLIDGINAGKFSIDPEILAMKISKKGELFTVHDRLMKERLVLRWRKEDNPKEIIRKVDMKQIIGHSPDFIEALIYLGYAIYRATKMRRKIVTRGLGFMC